MKLVNFCYLFCAGGIFHENSQCWKEQVGVGVGEVGVGGRFKMYSVL